MRENERDLEMHDIQSDGASALGSLCVDLKQPSNVWSVFHPTVEACLRWLATD